MEGFILGLVQGLGEFLPISSSGHLVVIRWLLGWQDQGLSFDVALHFGTTIAVLLYFRKDWARLLSAVLKLRPSDLRNFSSASEDKKLAMFLFLGTIPTGIIALSLEDWAEHTFRHPLLVASTLGVFGIVLWLVDKYGKRNRSESQLRIRDAILMGIAQGLAVIPGTSRSGITITMALLLAFSRKASTRLSFLLSMPIVVGACVLKLRHFTAADISMDLVVGVVISAVSGYLAIGGLIRFVQARSYFAFAVYRVILAGFIFILFFRRGS